MNRSTPSLRGSALIADDEPLARDRLKALLQEMGYQIAGEAANGDSALAQCASLRPDIALLDIQMPGMSGLDVAEALRGFQSPPAVIFTTAYDQYAIPAFEVQAVDYLLKPIRRERLQQALAKAESFQAPPQTESVAPAPQRQYISARHQGNIRLVPLEDIFYFRAEDKYITVRHKNGEVLLEESLKHLSRIYSDRFIRVHRNALVAKHAVLALEKDVLGQYRLRLRETEERIDVSRRHVSQVRNALKRL